MKIEEGNKCIAEFIELGGFDDSRYGWLWHNPTSDNKKSSCFSLKFHSSWDWLMPACQKCKDIIEKSGDIQAIDIELMRAKSLLLVSIQTFNIETVWLAVIKFIKCYNENKLLEL